ncbi:hypothetical protein J3A83DRAFT_4084731 [Scleroderma citrinum]
MVSLGADSSILDQYQPLEPYHLQISTAVTDPNACGHHHDHLTWFWTMDIPKDTNKDDWMSEFHWLQVKSLRDQWEEKVELLTCKLQWTQHFFESKAKF